MIINASDFPISTLDRLGNGGVIKIIQTNEVRYYFKSENLGQSINEVVGQEYLRTLGYPSVPTAWIRYRGNTYGALAEVRGERITYLGELFFMNLFLENADAGEYYSCDDGAIRCIDLGETIMSVIFIGYLAQGCPIPVPSKDMRKVFSIAYETGCSFGSSQDGHNALCRIRDYDEQKMSSCFRDLERIFSPRLANVYRNHFREMKVAAASIIDEMPLPN